MTSTDEGVLLGGRFHRSIVNVIYICFIFRLVRAVVIYVPDVDTNLKCIIHPSAEHLFGYIFYAIAASETMIYRLLISP